MTSKPRALKPRLTKEEKRAKKAGRKIEKKHRKQRWKLCHVTVYFPEDHTCVHREVEITEAGTHVTIEGHDYPVSLKLVQREMGWWPFKARSFKRTLFKDEYYSLDFIAWSEKPITLIDQTEAAEYTHMTPAMLKSMVPEQMFRESIQSMKFRGKVQINPKIFILFAVAAVVGILIAHYVLGVF